MVLVPFLLFLVSITISSGLYRQIHSEEQERPEDNCHTALGVASSGAAHSYWLYSSDGDAYKGRLDQSEAWISEKPLYPSAPDTDRNSYAWLQVDLGRPMLVTGLQTQGDPESDTWVTWLSVLYSKDCEVFTPLLNANGNVATFHGNFDSNSSVTTLFHEVVVSRCVRVVPLQRQGNWTALRIELLGCDVRLCREAILHHMVAEVDPRAYVLPSVASPGEQKLNQLKPGWTPPPLPVRTLFRKPTAITREYSEFKFPAEKLLLGVVFFLSTKSSNERYVITYSRNCHDWDVIQEKKGNDDPKIFRESRSRYRTTWHTFPYPVRAQCVRLVPFSHRYVARATPVRAHFIGCGTGDGVIAQCGLQKTHHRSKRVVSGRPSSAPGMWPWLVSVQTKDEDTNKFRHRCGGTIIHPQWVLTAAHCIAVMYEELYGGPFQFNATELNQKAFLKALSVRLGEHSLQVHEGTATDLRISKIILHPDYNVSFYINDMALLRLRQRTRLTDHASVVCLPDSEEYFWNVTSCHVVGWGKTVSGYPARPHYVQMELFPRDTCQDIFTHLTITPDMLCAGHLDGSADACLGDSGGPLVCERGGQWFQIGVVSWNIGCAHVGYPGVYARIPSFIDWIDDIIQADENNALK